MYYVYKITNKINEKVYIGKSTTNGADRWKTHLQISKGNKIKYPRLFFAVHAAIKKYGETNFSFEIIKNCKEENEAFISEIQIINGLRISGIKLYNLTNGGEGPVGAKRSKESKRKMSLAHQQPGYTTGRQKLTIESVIQIKLLLIENQIKMKDIAKLFSVNFQAISAINRGKSWAWVIVPNFIKAKRIPNRKLSETDVKNIRELLSQKISYRKIASQFNVSVACIQKIKNGKTFILE